MINILGKTLFFFGHIFLCLAIPLVTLEIMIAIMGGYKYFNSEIGFGFSVYFGLAVLTCLVYGPILVFKKSGLLLTAIASTLIFLLPIVNFLYAVKWNPVFENPVNIIFAIVAACVAHWLLFNILIYFTLKGRRAESTTGSANMNDYLLSIRLNDIASFVFVFGVIFVIFRVSKRTEKSFLRILVGLEKRALFELTTPKERILIVLLFVSLFFLSFIYLKNIKTIADVVAAFF